MRDHPALALFLLDLTFSWWVYHLVIVFVNVVHMAVQCVANVIFSNVAGGDGKFLVPTTCQDVVKMLDKVVAGTLIECKLLPRLDKVHMEGVLIEEVAGTTALVEEYFIVIKRRVVAGQLLVGGDTEEFLEVNTNDFLWISSAQGDIHETQ